MERFEEIKACDLNENYVDLISRQWMLITAGDQNVCNTMTANWAMAGHLWGRDVTAIFLRPQRCTKRFVDSEARYTLSFFDEEYKKALVYCGVNSGGNEDKIRNAGLSVIYTPDGTPAIGEAKMIIECRKLYADKLKPESFIDAPLVESVYPDADFHEMYIGEIIHIYIK